MKRRSIHTFAMTRPEVERMIRDWVGQDIAGQMEIERIDFDAGNLAPPQPVLTFVVTEEHEEETL